MASKEYPQYMFAWRNKKISIFLLEKCLIWSYDTPVYLFINSGIHNTTLWTDNNPLYLWKNFDMPQEICIYEIYLQIRCFLSTNRMKTNKQKFYLFFTMIVHVVGNHWNRLTKTIPMTTNNIYLHGKIRKNINLGTPLIWNCAWDGDEENLPYTFPNSKHPGPSCSKRR